jgi:hypothetical protein
MICLNQEKELAKLRVSNKLGLYCQGSRLATTPLRLGSAGSMGDLKQRLIQLYFSTGSTFVKCVINSRYFFNLSRLRVVVLIVPFCKTILLIYLVVFYYKNLTYEWSSPSYIL